MKGQGNSEVAGKMQQVASGLKASQGGTSSGLEGADYSCNQATKSGSGPDLSGHSSGGGGKK